MSTSVHAIAVLPAAIKERMFPIQVGLHPAIKQRFVHIQVDEDSFQVRPRPSAK